MRLHLLKCSLVAVAALMAGGGSSSARARFFPALFQSTTGLVGHWKMDTITAGSPASSPAAVGPNPLTLTAGGAARTGVFAGGIALGANDYMTVANNAAYNFADGDFTVALWCRPSGIVERRLINKWDGPLQQGWLLDVHSTTGGALQAGAIRFMLDTSTAGNTANDRVEVAAGAGLDSGNWRHIAVTVDRTALQIRVYMDGLPVPGSPFAIPGMFAGTVTNTFDIGIGTIPTSLGKYFNGGVDDLRLYNRPLTATEVLDVYTGGFTAIGVGNPGPVVPQRGLLGEYYNSTTNLGTLPTPSSPTSVIAPQDGNSTLIARRLDRVINNDLSAALRPPGVNDNNIYVEWSGSIVTDVAGSYTVSMRVDDGGRLWFNQNPLTQTPSVASWTTQPPTTYNAGPFNALPAQTAFPVRFEFYEAGSTQFAGLLWTQPGGASIPIEAVHLRPPAGPNAPANVTASTGPGLQVHLAWSPSTTPVAATNYIVLRSTTPGGPYSQVAVQAAPDIDFDDTNIVFGTTYYYVVQATAHGDILVGPPSTEVAHTPSPLGISPTSGLATSELPTNDTFTITVNIPPSGSDVSLQVTSSAPGEVLLSGNGPGQPLQGPGSPITIIIPDGTAAGTTIPITVLGQNDDIDDGDQPFSITFSVNGGGADYTGLTIAPVTGSNSDDDTANIIVSNLSGPTSENLTSATFTIVFTAQPTVDTTVTIGVSDPTEAAPAQTDYLFTAGPGPNSWDTVHTVTINGLDDTILDFTQSYTVTVTVTAGDATYQALTTPAITRNGSNLDNETIPKLEKVWGCGLLGAEIFLPLGLLALLRRRRRPV